MTVTDTPSAAPVGACGCPEGQSAGLTRRHLFRLTGAAGLATVTTASQARLAFGAATGADTLVVLSLRGGADGLSIVVPVGDPDYARRRPNIGLPASVLHRVDNVFGLHPALKPIFPLWDSGSMAAVHAVGQSNPTRSHFAAMDEMERAAPGSSLRTGYLDRVTGLVPDPSSFTAMQVGSATMPRSLLGDAPKFAMSSIAGVKIAIDEKVVPLSGWRSAVDRLHRGARPEVSRPLRSALSAVGSIRDLPAAPDAKAAGYPDGHLGAAMHDVARVIKADLGLRVATVDMGNFDMHEGLGKHDRGWMHDQLTELAGVLKAFADDLGPALDRVTLVTLSEFGRRVEENGSGGVDHGHGNAVLLLGGGVKGGKVYGTWPGLGDADLFDGDVKGTTDYRSIMAEVLTKRCGLGSIGDVFPGFTADPLGLVTAR